MPSLCAVHCTGLAKRSLARLFPLTWKLREAPLLGSPDQPFQNLPILGLPWLLLPPFVPGNPRALTWASLVLGWSTDYLKDPRLQSLPLLNPQSFGRLPSLHQPPTPGPVSMAAHTPHQELPGGPGCSLLSTPACGTGHRAAGVEGVGRWRTRVPPGCSKQPTVEAKHLQDCGWSLQDLGSMAWECRGGNFLFLDCGEGK